MMPEQLESYDSLVKVDIGNARDYDPYKYYYEIHKEGRMIKRTLFSDLDKVKKNLQLMVKVYDTLNVLKTTNISTLAFSRTMNIMLDTTPQNHNSILV